MKKFFLIILFSIFWANNIMAKDTVSVENFSPEKLFEEAELGNADAQYRLARLIYVGGIKNWRELNHENYLSAAAEQGHPEATYDWYDWINSTRRTQNDYIEQLKPVKGLLVRLSKKNEAMANLLMFYILRDEIYSKRKDEGYSSKIDSLTAYKYLEAASALGSRQARDRYASVIANGYYEGKKQDIPLAISMLKEALLMPADHNQDKKAYDSQTCNILNDLHQYYLGEKYLDIDGKLKAYEGSKDVSKLMETLDLGRSYGCSTLMKVLAKILLDGSEPDFFDIYSLLAEALAIDELDDFQLADENDYTHFLLGITAIELDDLKTSRNHFSKVEGDRWRDIILHEFGEGSKLCRRSKVELKKCKEFIFN